MDCKVRLLEINVKNLKNLGNGTICFDSYNKVLKGKFDFEESDIVGVYGPNGSSKSSLIDALSIIKSLFINDPLDHELYDYVSINKDKLELSLKNAKNNGENIIYDIEKSILNDFEKGQIRLFVIVNPSFAPQYLFKFFI